MNYYYDDRGGPKKGSSPKSDVGSWITIAVLFALGLWPVGLFLLISKLSDGSRRANTSHSAPTAAASGAKTSATAGSSQPKVAKVVQDMTKTPQYSDKAINVMKIAGLALMAVGVMGIFDVLSDLSYYTAVKDWLGMLGEMFSPLGMGLGGLALLLGGRGMTRRSRRFAKYLAVAGKDQAISLQRLARAAEVSQRKLEKDLEIMVEKGLWGPGAYVDLGAGMLFRSQEAAAQYNARTARDSESAPSQVEEGYSGMLRQIRRANDRIADPVLSAKIDRLEEITGRIFKIIEAEPQKKQKASKFLNYYLPTTQKLLDNYAEFEEAGVSGANLDQAKGKIEQTMDNIVAGFERQLDELFQADAMDIDSDIRVMESMLRRDGASVETDFGLDGTAMEESGE